MAHYHITTNKEGEFKLYRCWECQYIQAMDAPCLKCGHGMMQSFFADLMDLEYDGVYIDYGDDFAWEGDNCYNEIAVSFFDTRHFKAYAFVAEKDGRWYGNYEYGYPGQLDGCGMGTGCPGYYKDSFATKEECLIACAEALLPNFKKKHPNGTKPDKVNAAIKRQIEELKEQLKNKTEICI